MQKQESIDLTPITHMEDSRRKVKGGYLSIGQVQIVRYRANAEAVFRV